MVDKEETFSLVVYSH